MKENLKEMFITCDCRSAEHILRYTYLIEDDEKELFTEVYLHQYNSFWKRMWIGIKYVFGYRCKYGHWDCVLITEEDAKRLKSFLETFLNDNRKETKAVKG